MHNQMRTAMSEVMSAANTFGRTEDIKEGVVSTFRTTHRTIQQNVMRLVILPILTYLADCYVNGTYDARNEASCRLAQRMLAAVNEDDTYLPYV